MLENSHFSVLTWMSDQYFSPLRRVKSNSQSTRSTNNICLKTLSELNQSDTQQTEWALWQKASLWRYMISHKNQLQNIYWRLRNTSYLCLNVAHLKQKKRDYPTGRKHCIYNSFFWHKLYRHRLLTNIQNRVHLSCFEWTWNQDFQS